MAYSQDISMADFYALIHQDSKYYGQDGGKPFAVSLVHSVDGYIWEGGPGRYRMTDLVLLTATESPLKQAEPIPVLVFDERDAIPANGEEAQLLYRKQLSDAEWFRPITNQAVTPGFKYVRRDGKIYDVVGHEV